MIKFDLRYNPPNCTYDIYIWDVYEKDQHVLVEAGGVFTWEYVLSGTEASKPTFQLKDPRSFQPLLDELRHSSSGSTERAMQEHIETLKDHYDSIHRLFAFNLGIK